MCRLSYGALTPTKAQVNFLPIEKCRVDLETEKSYLSRNLNQGLRDSDYSALPLHHKTFLVSIQEHFEVHSVLNAMNEIIAYSVSLQKSNKQCFLKLN